jgi:hypothetical protein
MRHSILAVLLICVLLETNAQKNQRFSIELNYGLNGNFFVRSYDETAPPSVKFFYKKKFVGQIGGLEIKYRLTPVSTIGLAYASSTNKREINYQNGINATILYFDISHINHFYQLVYERAFSKRNNALNFNGGIFYLRMKQQEVEVSPAGVLFEERDFRHYNLEEGGVFAGLHYSKYIDKKLELGIRSRFYFLISTGEPEAITLTPTLTYHF